MALSVTSTGTVVPTLRTAPPARCETPIHVERTARSGSGRPPDRVLVPRGVGALRAGDAFGRAVLRGVAEPRLAVEAREDAEDGRVAMIRRVRDSHSRLTCHTRISGRLSVTRALESRSQLAG